MTGRRSGNQMSVVQLSCDNLEGKLFEDYKENSMEFLD